MCFIGFYLFVFSVFVEFLVLFGVLLCSVCGSVWGYVWFCVGLCVVHRNSSAPSLR